MDTREQLIEALTKTTHSLEFAGNDLRAALRASGAVAGIPVLSLIGKCTELEIYVQDLLKAVAADAVESA